jgi:hypothetical protein
LIDIQHRILKTEQHEYYKWTKGQTRIYNILHRILKTEQHEYYKRTKGQTRTYAMIFDWVVLLLRNVSRPVYNRKLLSSNIISQYCDVLRKNIVVIKAQHTTQNMKNWATRILQKDERTNTYLQHTTQNIKNWSFCIYLCCWCFPLGVYFNVCLFSYLYRLYSFFVFIYCLVYVMWLYVSFLNKHCKKECVHCRNYNYIIV